MKIIDFVNGMFEMISVPQTLKSVSKRRKFFLSKLYEIRKDKLIEIRKIKIDYSKIQNFPNLRRRPLHHTADKNDSAYVMQDQRLLNYSAFTPFPKKGIFSIFISVYGIFIYEYLKKN